jgi:hypothetical protein
VRYIDSCIPKSKLSNSNMIATVTRQYGDVFFAAMLVIEDDDITDIGLHGPFASCAEGRTFTYDWTGRNEGDLNAGRAVRVPDDDSIPAETREHLVRCFKGAFEHGENLCSYQPETV